SGNGSRKTIHRYWSGTAPWRSRSRCLGIAERSIASQREPPTFRECPRVARAEHQVAVALVGPDRGGVEQRIHWIHLHGQVDIDVAQARKQAQAAVAVVTRVPYTGGIDEPRIQVGLGVRQGTIVAVGDAEEDEIGKHAEVIALPFDTQQKGAVDLVDDVGEL